MKNTLRLCDTLVQVLSQHRKWLDVRHLKTLAWMMTGLIESGLISLTQWVPFVHGRAVYAQSSVRRFTRWLVNERIDVHKLYGPLIQQALGTWGRHTLYLALDTSMLWEQYCVMRISVIYRGRAIPLVWQVIAHASSSVTYETYRALLDTPATLLPLNCEVVFLADRGFADTALMAHATRLGWRIRIKGCFVVYRRGQRRLKLSDYELKPGQAHFWHHVQITDERYGPVYLALAHLAENDERWLVVSDEPTSLTTLDEYGFRFDIETEIRADKSGLKMNLRRKHSLNAQEGWLILTDVAHNFLAWLQPWMLAGSPCAGFGPKRLVQDLLTIPWSLTFEANRLQKVALLETHPYAEPMCQCLHKLLQTFDLA